MSKKQTEKKICEITRAAFRAGAQAALESLVKKLADELPLEVKEFSSGGFGYYGGGKITLRIGNKPVRLQVGINAVVVNSKDAEEGEPENLLSLAQAASA